MASRPDICSLPSELLIHILANLSIESLLPLIQVSHRFYSATLRILKDRLNRATTLPDHRLMLECYHPTDRLYTPYLYCNYLYTDSLDSLEAEAEGGGPEKQQRTPSRTPQMTAAPVTRGLHGIYSHFRPVSEDVPPPRRRNRRRHDASPHRDSGEEAAAPIDVYLDPDEHFAQLCAITNLVRMSPKPGLFRSHVNVVDGLARVWRGWLAAQASGQASPGSSDEDDAILWTDAARTVGLRFRVREKDIRAEHPVLVASDEELPVAYRLEFDELLVRSTTLLESVERSEVQEITAEGRAVVLASF